MKTKQILKISIQYAKQKNIQLKSSIMYGDDKNMLGELK